MTSAVNVINIKHVTCMMSAVQRRIRRFTDGAVELHVVVHVRVEL